MDYMNTSYLNGFINVVFLFYNILRFHGTLEMLTTKDGNSSGSQPTTPTLGMVMNILTLRDPRTQPLLPPSTMPGLPISYTGIVLKNIFFLTYIYI
jgi:hypothetical protein